MTKPEKMNDIVERLRDLGDANKSYPQGDLWRGLNEAADEINRLRAVLAKIVNEAALFGLFSCEVAAICPSVNPSINACNARRS